MSSLTDVLDPGGGAKGRFGEIGQFVTDPLDLFGVRAEDAQGRISDILRRSASQNIDLQERQLTEIEGLTEPFRATARDTALPALRSLALGGDVDFQPSPLFGRQLDIGREGILKQQAGRGGLKSSATFERLADLVTGLAGEDMGRFEQGNVGLLNAGVGANRALDQAGTELTGNISGAFSNLGSGLAQSQQQLGQARQSSFQGLSSGLTGLSDFLATTRPQSN